MELAAALNKSSDKKRKLFRVNGNWKVTEPSEPRGSERHKYVPSDFDSIRSYTFSFKRAYNSLCPSVPKVIFFKQLSLVVNK